MPSLCSIIVEAKTEMNHYFVVYSISNWKWIYSLCIRIYGEAVEHYGFEWAIIVMLDILDIILLHCNYNDSSVG